MAKVLKDNLTIITFDYKQLQKLAFKASRFAGVSPRNGSIWGQILVLR